MRKNEGAENSKELRILGRAGSNSQIATYPSHKSYSQFDTQFADEIGEMTAFSRLKGNGVIRSLIFNPYLSDDSEGNIPDENEYPAILNVSERNLDQVRNLISFTSLKEKCRESIER
jgi:hypothetical protein